MMTKTRIHDTTVLLYSVGLVAASVDRHPNTIRRLERSGVLPGSYMRSEKNYRLYTEHELRIIKSVFNKHGLSRGIPFPDNIGDVFKTLFDKLHAAYAENKWENIPEEALTKIEKGTMNAIEKE